MAFLAVLTLLTASATAAATAEGVPQPLSERTWEVITAQGQPVQDPARIALLTAVVADFNQYSPYMPLGTSVVVFPDYGDKTRIDPGNEQSGLAMDAGARMVSKGGDTHFAERSKQHEGWNAILWRPTNERQWEFVYQRWGCAPIHVPLVDRNGCIIDVGDQRPVPVPTFDQRIRLVDGDGKVVDAGGTVRVSMSGSWNPCRHEAAFVHGLATVPGVFSGYFTLSGDLSVDGYRFGDERTVECKPGSILDVTISGTKYPTTSPACEKPLPWVTDFQAAVRSATQAGKPLLLEFTGSDWCGWCKRLHQEVFDTKAFTEWAQKRVILVEVDFPDKTPQEAALKEQNAALAERFHIGGYPSIVFLDPTGTKVLGTMGYEKGGPFLWTVTADAILDKKSR